MTVTVKLFAILRDKAEIAEFPLELSNNSTVSSALNAIAARCPALKPHLSRCAAAVNLERATPDTILNDRDELALLPPVSGG